MNVFWMLFLNFKLCQLAIFEQVDVGKGDIHLFKSLKEEHYLKKGVNGENIWRTQHPVKLPLAIYIYITVARFGISIDGFPDSEKTYPIINFHT